MEKVDTFAVLLQKKNANNGAGGDKLLPEYFGKAAREKKHGLAIFGGGTLPKTGLIAKPCGRTNPESLPILEVDTFVVLLQNRAPKTEPVALATVRILWKTCL